MVEVVDQVRVLEHSLGFRQDVFALVVVACADMCEHQIADACALGGLCGLDGGGMEMVLGQTSLGIHVGALVDQDVGAFGSLFDALRLHGVAGVHHTYPLLDRPYDVLGPDVPYRFTPFEAGHVGAVLYSESQRLLAVQLPWDVRFGDGEPYRRDAVIGGENGHLHRADHELLPGIDVL